MDKCYIKNFKRCCCTCKHQEEISKHPWNKEEFSKGSISESIGWGCVVGMAMLDNNSEYPRITFSDSAHSVCELHQNKITSEKSGFISINLDKGRVRIIQHS